jgi:hypothetical protein
VNSTNDGGPAFPSPVGERADGSPVYYSDGMTLRDYFAGQALSGIALWNRGQGGSFVNADDAKDAGVLAYQLADAMLAAREVKP